MRNLHCALFESGFFNGIGLSVSCIAVFIVFYHWDAKLSFGDEFFLSCLDVVYISAILLPVGCYLSSSLSVSVFRVASEFCSFNTAIITSLAIK